MLKKLLPTDYWSQNSTDQEASVKVYCGVVTFFYINRMQLASVRESTSLIFPSPFDHSCVRASIHMCGTLFTFVSIQWDLDVPAQPINEYAFG
jgi:hypothetical protein